MRALAPPVHGGRPLPIGAPRARRRRRRRMGAAVPAGAAAARARAARGSRSPADGAQAANPRAPAPRPPKPGAWRCLCLHRGAQFAFWPPETLPGPAARQTNPATGRREAPAAPRGRAPRPRAAMTDAKALDPGAPGRVRCGGARRGAGRRRRCVCACRAPPRRARPAPRRCLPQAAPPQPRDVCAHLAPPAAARPASAAAAAAAAAGRRDTHAAPPCPRPLCPRPSQERARRGVGVVLFPGRRHAGEGVRIRRERVAAGAGGSRSGWQRERVAAGAGGSGSAWPTAGGGGSDAPGPPPPAGASAGPPTAPAYHGSLPLPTQLHPPPPGPLERAYLGGRLLRGHVAGAAAPPGGA
jgi:hypothetical protein